MSPPVLVWGVSEDANDDILYSLIRWNVIFGGVVILVDLFSLILISEYHMH